jgi:putative glutamine amidotransferase
MRTALPRKTIMIEPDSRLGRIIGRRRDRVNALHHQSIDRLGEGLRIVARDEHQIVQAVERLAEPFLVGVQWHPEFMVFNGGQQRLFRALAAASKARAVR